MVDRGQKARDAGGVNSLTRRGELSDVPELLRLRVLMFDDIGVDTSGREWKRTCRDDLERGLSRGDLIGAVIDDDEGGGLVAGGLLQVQERLATPRFPNGTFGYLGSVAVERSRRRQGLGTRVVVALIDEARQLGLERVELHATDDGEGIYRALGFDERGGGLEMRLVLRH